MYTLNVIVDYSNFFLISCIKSILIFIILLFFKYFFNFIYKYYNKIIKHESLDILLFN